MTGKDSSISEKLLVAADDISGFVTALVANTNRETIKLML